MTRAIDLIGLEDIEPNARARHALLELALAMPEGTTARSDATGVALAAAYSEAWASPPRSAFELVTLVSRHVQGLSYQVGEDVAHLFPGFTPARGIVAIERQLYPDAYDFDAYGDALEDTDVIDARWRRRAVAVAYALRVRRAEAA